jgi:hypothetical protein
VGPDLPFRLLVFPLVAEILPFTSVQAAPQSLH